MILASVKRSDGHTLVVTRLPTGDVVLRMMGPDGRESRSWYMCIRKAELAAVAAALVVASPK